MYGVKDNFSLQHKAAIFVIVEAIKRKKFLWLATQAAKYISVNIKVDPKTNKVSFSAKVKDKTKINYDDIKKIFTKNKIDVNDWYSKAYEEKKEDGTFKRYSGKT